MYRSLRGWFRYTILPSSPLHPFCAVQHAMIFLLFYFNTFDAYFILFSSYFFSLFNVYVLVRYHCLLLLRASTTLPLTNLSTPIALPSHTHPYSHTRTHIHTHTNKHKHTHTHILVGSSHGHRFSLPPHGVPPPSRIFLPFLHPLFYTVCGT